MDTFVGQCLPVFGKFGQKVTSIHLGKSCLYTVCRPEVDYPSGGLCICMGHSDSAGMVSEKASTHTKVWSGWILSPAEHTPACLEAGSEGCERKEVQCAQS